jgi:hypothetical protein
MSAAGAVVGALVMLVMPPVTFLPAIAAVVAVELFFVVTADATVVVVVVEPAAVVEVEAPVCPGAVEVVEDSALVVDVDVDAVDAAFLLVPPHAVAPRPTQMATAATV